MIGSTLKSGFMWRADVPALVAACLIALLAWVMCIAPTNREVDERERRLKAIAGQSSEVDRKARVKADLERRLDALNRSIDEVGHVLQPLAKLNQQLGLLNQLASEAGVAIDEVRVDDVIPGRDYQTVPIRLEGSGGYTSATRLINRLHAAMPGLGVESFHLTGNPGAPGASSRVVLNLAWYTSSEAPRITSASN
ncbi:MAG: GspMb/PilO family protein [Planctomycetota bacterium]|jgi:Tfp pilus assembly protein PilO